ncbi:MAG: type II toxin-antitoxin system VapC family toxin [Calditrichaceae bacterium]|nr:type II toxin-antitoxin system VapC family toxin [Calditrichaceae bacterium]
MIVVDTNVIAYLFFQGDYSKNAVALLKYDPIWIVPFLWKSEFRNVLTLYIRQGNLSLEDAQIMTANLQL